ncbi:MAG: Uncharacterized protein FD167_4275 [bacterium]|nr:MAG: Uncharacterized protein FD167_4275 [bacterium]
MKKIFTCILLAFFLIDCNDSKKTNTKPSPVNSPIIIDVENTKTIQGDFSEKKALEFLYGNYDETQKESNWQPTKEDLAKIDENSLLKDEKDFTVTALLVNPFQQASIDKYLLITAALAPERACHACAPMIGSFIFKKNGNTWDLEIEEKCLLELGSYGIPPDAKLIKIGKDNYATLFETSDTGQGRNYQGITVFAKIDKAFSNVLDIETGEDNSGNCGDNLAPCWSYSSKYEFVPGKNENFFDFKITTTGTSGAEGEKTTASVNENKLYQFDGKEYKAPK